MPKVSKFNKSPLTKKRFEELLTKAAQPLPQDSKGSGKSVVRRSDGYSEKRKSQDKTEGKED